MHTSSDLPITSEFWQALFHADSIAVIGANNNIGSWGYDAFQTALTSKTTKTDRRVYPVNPSTKEVQGFPAFANVLEIPDTVDLAIIVVRAEFAENVMRQCAEKKIKAAVIISAGFAETDAVGAQLQDNILKIAHSGGFHFVGPNCVGHGDAHTLVASAGMLKRFGKGPFSLLSQSGTLGGTILQMASERGMGISKFVSTGNEGDLRMEDYLEYLGNDENTKVIACYIEGLREGRRFFETAKRITPHKPIVVVKTGTTPGASQAAKSHTGALAGSDIIYTTAFKQSGVIRVEDEEEMCDVALGLLNCPLPKGNRVGILTMGGGFGVITAEACEKEGLEIGTLSPQTIDKINAILPSRWSHSNPVDLVGVRTLGGDPTADYCLEILMDDPNIDVVISLMPPIVLPPEMGGQLSPEKTKKMFDAAEQQRILMQRKVDETGKPLILLRFVFRVPEGNKVPGFKIPEYTHPRRAAKVLSHLARYREYLSRI